MTREATSQPTGGGLQAVPALRLAIIEVDDVVPRRVGDRPNLVVILTLDTEAKLGALAAGRGKPKWARERVKRLRPDLADPSDATGRDACRRLAGLGFTVNRDQRLWRVYVVELSPSPPGTVGWVYVGETAIDVDRRIEQHRTLAVGAHGKLYSPVVAKHFLRRRPDLEPVGPLFDRDQAKAEESATAERLAGLGFKVAGGH